MIWMGYTGANISTPNTTPATARDRLDVTVVRSKAYAGITAYPQLWFTIRTNKARKLTPMTAWGHALGGLLRNPMKTTAPNDSMSTIGYAATKA